MLVRLCAVMAVLDKVCQAGDIRVQLVVEIVVRMVIDL